MKILSERKYLNVIFLTAFLVLISSNILVYIFIDDHFLNDSLRTESRNLNYTAGNLKSAIYETESSERAYLISGNSEFLNIYKAKLSKIDSLSSSLKNFYYKFSRKSASLDSLIFYLKLGFSTTEQLTIFYSLEDSVKKENYSGYDFNESVYKSHSIRLIDRIISDENIISEKSLEDANKTYNYTLTNMIVGTIVSFLLLSVSFIILNRKISQQHKTEQELEESRNWFSTTLKSIGDGVIVTDHFGSITFMNPVAEEITGWKENQVKGVFIENFFNIILEDTHEKVENPVSRAFRTGRYTGEENNTLLLDKNNRGIPVDISASPIYDDEYKIIGSVLVFRDVSFRRKSEKELRENQRFISRITESTPNIIFIMEPAGPKVVYANGKITNVLGYTKEQVKSMGKDFFLKIFHPDDLIKMMSELKKYKNISEDEVITNEYRLKNSNGEWRWFSTHGVVFMKDSSGTPVQILGTAIDITDKKKLEGELQNYSNHLEELVEKRTSELRNTYEKLKEEIVERTRAEKNIFQAEEKFRSLVEYSIVGIYIIQDGKYIYVNPKYEELFGYSRDELIGTDIMNLVYPEDRELVSENIRKRLEGEINSLQYTLRTVKKDKSVIDVEVSASTMEYNGKLAIIGSLQDITDRKRMEKALLSEHELFVGGPVIVFRWIAAPNWPVEYVSSNVFKEYGYKPEQLTSGEILYASLIHPDDLVRIADEVTLHNENNSDTFEQYYRIRNAAGEYRDIYDFTIPVRDKENIVTHYEGYVLDISEIKKAEEKIKRSLNEKELLLKEIHHRVKNNLQIIISLLKLQKNYVFDERDKGIFDKSRARVETMSLIHEKLYKSSDISSINFGHYIEDLAAQILKAYGLTGSNISLNVKTENITLSIDTAIPSGLIINELVTNSIKYAFPDNRQGKIDIEVSKENDSIIFIVADNGIGLPHNFDISSEKTMGLQLVNTLVRQLDGEIWIDSSKGTKFTIVCTEMKYRERFKTT